MSETSGRYKWEQTAESKCDIHDVSDLENKIHNKFDRIDYENLNKGELAMLRISLKTLNRLVDRILYGYYKNEGHIAAEIAEELELDRVDVRPMKEAANE